MGPQEGEAPLRNQEDSGEGVKVSGIHMVVLMGPVGRSLSEKLRELAPVQTSSRNTENNHILLIIAKENTLRLQLNYVRTELAGSAGALSLGLGFPASLGGDETGLQAREALAVEDPCSPVLRGVTTLA